MTGMGFLVINALTQAGYRIDTSGTSHIPYNTDVTSMSRHDFNIVIHTVSMI